ncbi:MAG: VapC toxin family PIN domain ribonuclease, partial [Deltaproteobacteria bacterium]|nr:VapC toxin family PIN domain ribonuclease [Deltaproteobacteria bacterium]
DLIDWQVERIPHVELIREAWRHRRNASAYDSFSVALASVYDVPLTTADGPLSRAPALGIVVQNIHIG